MQRCVCVQCTVCVCVCLYRVQYVCVCLYRVQYVCVCTVCVWFPTWLAVSVLPLGLSPPGDPDLDRSDSEGTADRGGEACAEGGSECRLTMSSPSSSSPSSSSSYILILLLLLVLLLHGYRVVSSSLRPLVAEHQVHQVLLLSAGVCGDVAQQQVLAELLDAQLHEPRALEGGGAQQVAGGTAPQVLLRQGARRAETLLAVATDVLREGGGARDRERESIVREDWLLYNCFLIKVLFYSLKII